MPSEWLLESVAVTKKWLCLNQVLVLNQERTIPRHIQLLYISVMIICKYWNPAPKEISSEEEYHRHPSPVEVWSYFIMVQQETLQYPWQEQKLRWSAQEIAAEEQKASENQDKMLGVPVTPQQNWHQWLTKYYFFCYATILRLKWKKNSEVNCQLQSSSFKYIKEKNNYAENICLRFIDVYTSICKFRTLTEYSFFNQW